MVILRSSKYEIHRLLLVVFSSELGNFAQLPPHAVFVKESHGSPNRLQHGEIRAKHWAHGYVARSHSLSGGPPRATEFSLAPWAPEFIATDRWSWKVAVPPSTPTPWPLWQFY